MKNIKTLILGVVAMATSSAMAQTIAPTEKVFIEPGKTANVEFAISGCEEKVALAEFDLYLPEGITVAYDEEEEDYIYEKNGDMLIKSHTVSVVPKTDGSGAIYVLVKNESGKEFKQVNGTYLTLTLQASDNFSGTATAEMKKILLCRLDASEIVTDGENSFVITSELETEDVYTVAGAYKVNDVEEDSFFGTKWAPGLEANDLVKGDDGIYTKTFSEVELPLYGTILYKVVKNHSWDVNWGFNGNNADYYVNKPEDAPEDAVSGKFNITFKFNPEVPFANTFNVDIDVECLSITTGIRNINVDGENGNVYNTAGQRVSRTTKGLFIQNGKKVVKK